MLRAVNFLCLKFAPKKYPGAEDESKSMKERRVFSAMVSALDIAIGRIVHKLKEEGMYDNSIILFSSDVSAQGSQECINRYQLSSD